MMEEKKENPGAHVHVREDGTVYVHTHGQGESHAHTYGQDEGHAHTHGQGESHAHTHGQDEESAHSHGGRHSHTHDPEQVKSVLNRISRAIGHLESIKRMVEDGRDCSEVLIQLSAVRAAINNTGKVILQDHIQHCLVDAVETGDMETVRELNKAIDRFIK